MPEPIQSPQSRPKPTHVRLVVGLVVAAIIAALVVFMVVLKSDRTSPVDDPISTDLASVALPAGVRSHSDPLALAFPVSVTQGTPVVSIWMDPQCPACAAVDKAVGRQLTQAAQAGKISLYYRPTIFLDRGLGGTHSLQAAAAWGCAIDAGAGVRFHDIMFASQPEHEGDGWTDAELVNMASQAGTSDISLFTSCLAEGTYQDWAKASNELFYSSGATSTPWITVNGVKIPNTLASDPDQFMAAVTSAGTV